MTRFFLVGFALLAMSCSSREPEPGSPPSRSEPAEVVLLGEPATYQVEPLDYLAVTTSPSGPVAISQSLEGRLVATQLWPDGEIFEASYDLAEPGRLQSYAGGGSPSALLLGGGDEEHQLWEVRDDGLVAQSFHLPEDWSREGAVDGNGVYMGYGKKLLSIAPSGVVSPVPLTFDAYVRWVSTGHGLVLVSSTDDYLEIFDPVSGERWIHQDLAAVLMVTLDRRTVVVRDIDEMVVLDLAPNGFVEVLQRTPWPRLDDRLMMLVSSAQGSALVSWSLHGEFVVQPMERR